MKKILVTGGNGFVGSHLVDKLKQIHKITVFDIAKRKDHQADNNTRLIKGDLTDFNLLKEIANNFDGIIHLGAISRVKEGNSNPQNCMNVNIMGTINILEMIRTSKKHPWVILGSTNETPTNIYGLSKHISELCVERYAKDYDLRSMVLKFSSIYGPMDNPDKLIPKLIHRALNNKDIIINNSETSFDFIYIDDVVDGILSSINYIENIGNKYYDVFPLCTGETTSLRSLAKLIVEEASSNSKIIIKEEKKEANLVLDPKKANDILNFKTKIDIGEGIKLLVQKW